MVEKTSHFHGYFLRIWILLSMNNNFLGIRGLYKTHMDELKPFNSKSVTYTYIGYTEHNSRGQPIVRRLKFCFLSWNIFLFLIRISSSHSIWIFFFKIIHILNGIFSFSCYYFMILKIKSLFSRGHRTKAFISCLGNWKYFLKLHI